MTMPFEGRSYGSFLTISRSIWNLHQRLRCLTELSMSNTITVRLPEELGQWLEEESRVTGLPKGRIVREQLELSRSRKVRQPFLDLAGSVEGAPGLSKERGFQR